jgi:hypothetical protein
MQKARAIPFSSAAALCLSLGLAGPASADQARFDGLANLPFEQNRPTEETAQTLMGELTFQRATQTYLSAMPLLNTMGMRDGAAEAFGTGYNIMPIWTKRLDAKTHITTPNSDLIIRHCLCRSERDGAARLRVAAQAAGNPARFLAASDAGRWRRVLRRRGPAGP